jgi:hypothetical protein
VATSITAFLGKAPRGPTDEVPVALDQQPDLPGMALSGPADGFYLAYLDVWQRHITALEDEGIREVALNGPDTATRTRTVWQVKLLIERNPNAPELHLSIAGCGPGSRLTLRGPMRFHLRRQPRRRRAGRAATRHRVLERSGR